MACRAKSKNVNPLDQYSPIVCDAQYGKLYTKHINSDVEYIFVYSSQNVSNNYTLLFDVY